MVVFHLEGVATLRDRAYLVSLHSDGRIPLPGDVVNNSCKILEELGYWLSFLFFHSKFANKSACTVVTIGSHVDCINNANMNRKLERVSKFTQTCFAKISPGSDNFKLHNN